MTAAVEHAARSRRIEPGDEVHLFCCCDENLGLCGADLTDIPVVDRDDDVPCPMCFALEDDPCPFCGCMDCEESP